MKRIVYRKEDGGLAIVVPADCGLSIDEIAKRSVPKGIPYKVVDVSSVPSDRTFRDAWEIEDFEPEGFGERE